MRRLGPALCTVLFTLPCGITAQSAAAATTIGSNLIATADTHTCQLVGPGSLKCTTWNAGIPPADTAPGGVTSPINGVVVRWSLKVAGLLPGSQLTVAPRVIRITTGISTGPTQPIASGGTFTFDTRQPILAGDSIGVDAQITGTSGGNVDIVHDTGGSSYIWSPGFLPNSFTNPGPTVNDEVLMNADIEADGDGDGFGDETQDKCAGSSGPNDGCATPKGTTNGTTKDTTAPILSHASLSARKFAVDKSGAIARKRKGSVRGTTIRFTLSEAATVSLAIDRQRKGRKAKGKCKAKAKHGKRCKLFKSAGSFSFAGAAGHNDKPFSGRLKSGNLKAGPYKATLLATDAAGNKSKPTTLSFKVAK